MKKIIRRLRDIIRFCFVKIIGKIVYDPQYLTGKHFTNIDSPGWRVAEKDIWGRFFMGRNRGVKWPISSMVVTGKDVIFHPDDLNNFWGFGNYYQTIDGKIYIGKGTYIACNVGIITTNHDISDLDEHLPGKDVVIGEKCWIGMNSMILPGVVLGNHTIVGAGSIVTHSFEEGECIVAGNPARVIKQLK